MKVKPLLLAAILAVASCKSAAHKPSVGLMATPPPSGRVIGFDPSVVGLPGAIGDTVYDSAGVISWVKYDTSNTAWRPVPVSQFVTGDPSQAPGLKAPVGFQVTLTDGSASWIKKTSSDTGWVSNPVAGGGVPDGGYTVATDSTLTGSGSTRDGGALHVVGGQTGSWQVQYQIRAAGFLGTSNLSCLYWWFSNGVEGRTQNLVGASGVAQAISIPDTSGSDNNAVGGVGTFGTGTANTGASELLPGNTGAGRTPMNSPTHVTTKFYYASRFQVTSAVDSNALIGIGSHNWFPGVNGLNSTTKYSLGATTNGGSTHYVTSTVTIDANWHNQETYNDGVNGCYGVDVVAGAEAMNCVADSSWWNLTNPGSSSAGVFFDKTTGATNYTGAVNQALWCVAAP